MTCQWCRFRSTGNDSNPNGWAIRDRSKRIPRDLVVCSPCEKIIGDANMRKAGYIQSPKGEWKR